MNNLYLNKYHRIPDKGIGKLISINLQTAEKDYYFPELHNIEWFSMYDEHFPILKSFNRFEDQHLLKLAKYLELYSEENHSDLGYHTTEPETYREMSWIDEQMYRYTLRVNWNWKVEFFKENLQLELDCLYKSSQFFLDNDFGMQEPINLNLFGDNSWSFDTQGIHNEPEIYLDMLGLSTDIKLYKFKDFQDKVVPFGILVDKLLKKNVGLILDENSLNLLREALTSTNLLEIIYE